MRWFFRVGRGALLCALLASVIAVPASAAAADPPPPYDGLMSFPDITDSSGPEEFSWQVQLGQNEGLRSLDSQQAEIYYLDDDSHAVTIDAEKAHDAHGVRVPTTIAVSDDAIITLTVHHRPGNPAADGAPFFYPVAGGPSWVLGEGKVISEGQTIIDTLEDGALQRARELIERANPPATPEPPVTARACDVPALRGLTLKGAKRRLLRSGCRPGTVHRRLGSSGRAGRVVAQGFKPGASRPPGSAVAIVLAA